MKTKLFIILSVWALANLAFASDTVKIVTNMGDITVKLATVKAPQTVKNFMSYVKSGYYNGTVFHRVIRNFMIQGGGFDMNLARKDVKAPIQNEAANGLKNKRSTIAMARTSDPHSATAQFFINVAYNKSLNHTRKSPSGWGYAVFGEVIGGMSVVDKISKVKTGPAGPFRTDVPQPLVEIKKIEVVK